MTGDLSIRPVTGATWSDLVRLFEAHGNPNYCWCMLWRTSSAAYRSLGSAGRRAALQSRVAAGEAVGLLAYLGDDPAGWCSVAPRSSYARLERSRTLPRLDEQETWSVVCFFLAPAARRRGLAAELLRAAAGYAAAGGAQVLEGYPVDPVPDEQGRLRAPRAYRFMGYRRSFEAAGFQDATPPGARRTIMRRVLAGPGSGETGVS